jgi:hypothetical protein
MFVFGSWVCVADGAGSFYRFLVDMKPKTPAAGSHSDLDKSVDDLDDLSIHGSATRTEEESATARLHPALQQPSLGWTHSNLRTRVANHDLVYAIWPLIFRRPTYPSPFPHWRRTWTLYSNSESPKPPHVGGLRVVLVPMV